MYFRTKNSQYVVDFANKTVYGGALGNDPIPFERVDPIMVGDPAYFLLSDGREMRTSTVEKVNSVADSFGR